MQRNRKVLPIHMKDNQAIDNIFEGSHMLDLADKLHFKETFINMRNELKEKHSLSKRKGKIQMQNINEDIESISKRIL